MRKLLYSIFCFCFVVQIRCAEDLEALFAQARDHLNKGRIDESIECYTKCRVHRAYNLVSLYNIGYAYKTAGNVDTAIDIYKQVLAVNPDYDMAHLALGFAYLYKGDFSNGWKQHERYLKKSGKNADELRALLRQQQVAGKRILCTHEGGIGDTFMFVRYVEMLKALGAYVICAVQPATIPLLSRCPYIDELHVWQSTQLPSHDAAATVMSLAAVFNSSEETLPCNIPYLSADPALINYWKDKVATDKFKIGLCWQADLHNDESRLDIAHRGMPLILWESLLCAPDVALYSLQCFDGVEQIQNLPKECQLTVFPDLDTQHGRFMDSAAVIENMDLIITIDSAIAHLAGALGKPVLLLLPYSVDWRWLCGRTDSPWYPTMKIFKQQKPFSWSAVVDELYAYLRQTYCVHI